MLNWKMKQDFGTAYVEYAEEGRISRVTMNHPQTRNAMGPQADNHMMDAWMVAEEDEDISVIILRGAGKAFCSGAYMGPGGLGEQYGQRPSLRHRLYSDVRTPNHERIQYYSKKGTIAQVHGFAVGGGWRRSFYCDLIIAAEGTGFQYAEPRMIGAYHPNMQLFILRCGASLANQVMLTARWCSAEELYARGVIDGCVPIDKLEDEVERWARAIASLAKDVVCNGKMAMHMAYDGLGVAQGWGQGYYVHTMGVQQRLEDGDYNIFAGRTRAGAKGSIGDRETRYQDLGFNFKTPYSYHPGIKPNITPKK